MKTSRLLHFAGATLGALLCQAAFAVPLVYTASLSGPAESPPNASPGVGFATVTYDFTTHILAVTASFSGLTSGTTASHIHSATTLPGVGTAGVATQTPSFVGFPLGVTSGSFINSYDLTLASSWNPAFITAHGGTTAGAESFFADSLAAGTAYYNIHTTNFPSGEIRGFLVAASVPDSGATLTLLSAALLGFGGIARYARRRAA